VPATLLKRASRLPAGLRAIQEAAPVGPPIYLWREWGAFGIDVPIVGRDFDNGAEVDKCFSERGFELVDPLAVPVAEVIRKVAAAPFVAGLHGAQMAHILWANSRSIQLELIGPYGVSENHRALAEIVGVRTIHLASHLTSEGKSAMSVDELCSVLDDLGGRA